VSNRTNKTDRNPLPLWKEWNSFTHTTLSYPTWPKISRFWHQMSRLEPTPPSGEI